MAKISLIFLCSAVLTFGVFQSVSDAAIFSPKVGNGTVGVYGSLVVGNIGVGDRLLWRAVASKNGLNNAIQTEDVVFRGNVGTRITMLRAIELGNQGAQASLVGGGINLNFGAIRIRSAVSRGYTYSIDFWGR